MIENVHGGNSINMSPRIYMGRIYLQFTFSDGGYCTSKQLSFSQDQLFTISIQEAKFCFKFSIQQYKKKVFISITKSYQVLKREIIYIIRASC